MSVPAPGGQRAAAAAVRQLDLPGLTLLVQALEEAPTLSAVLAGPELTLLVQNRRSREVLGGRELGVPLTEAFPESAPTADGMRDVLLTGETYEEERLTRVRDVEGRELVLHFVVSALGSGPPYPAILVSGVDVTTAFRDREQARRAQLLAGITQAMTTASDPDAALQALTDALVPEVAAVAAVFVVPAAGSEPTGSSTPTAVTIDPALLAEIGPPPTGTQAEPEPAPWDSSIAAGRTVLIDLRGHDRDAVDPTSRSWLDRAGASTIVVVPLVVAGELAGALVLSDGAHRRPYEEADLPFLEDVAARAGTAVAHVRSVRAQWQVALDLQRALLPGVLPALREVDVATRYVAGSPEVDVGGDWFDVTDLGAGRFGMGVGDVSGRGLPAAAVMGQARAAMRAAAHAALGPGDLLGLLDTHVAELVAPQLESGARVPPRFATAVYGVLEPFDETLRLASAGHPPVLVRAPDGTVRAVSAPPGPPLGLAIGPFEELVTPFPPGSLLAAFTDGLVESRDVDVELGMSRIAARLGHAGSATDLEELADSLLTAAGADRAADDVALLLVRLSPSAAQLRRTQLLLSGLADVARARRAVSAIAQVAQPDRSAAIVQVTSELAANAVEHAGPPVELRAFATAQRVVVETTDRSALPPVRRHSGRDDERGRGLALVSALCDAWGVRLGLGGKTTWAEFRA
ncbi:MAG TPA: SpoIIE family protein phosphatase [Kineosporiaceae bacterium]|nr:SpoIIE family protein phosphatase [Kineosporiaceae bacterium]